MKNYLRMIEWRGVLLVLTVYSALFYALLSFAPSNWVGNPIQGTSQNQMVRRITATDTVRQSDYLIIIDSTASAGNLTLPRAVNKGRIVVIKNYSANAWSVKPFGSPTGDLIDTTHNLGISIAASQSMTLQDGTTAGGSGNWNIE